MNNNEIKNLLVEQAEVFMDFKNRVDGRIDKLEDEYAEAYKSSQRIDLGKGSSDFTSRREANAAFRDFILNGDKSGIMGMSVGSDPDGGYTVVPFLDTNIRNVPISTSPVRAVANQVKIETASYEVLVSPDEAGSSWVSETGARTETDAPELKKTIIEAHEQYAAPRVTQKLLEDSEINIADWLVNHVRDKFSRAENTAFITGDGVGKPRGILTYTTSSSDDDSREWGQLQYIASGASGAFTSSAPADKLLDVVYSLKAEYRDEASWLMNRSTARTIRKMKDGNGNYLWQPSTISGEPDTLLGFPVYLAEDMPALGANSLSIAFGNFGKGYTIVDRIGTKLLQDPYSAKPHVIFYCYKRTGGALVDSNAIKLLKFAAS